MELLGDCSSILKTNNIPANSAKNEILNSAGKNFFSLAMVLFSVENKGLVYFVVSATIFNLTNCLIKEREYLAIFLCSDGGYFTANFFTSCSKVCFF